MFQTDSASSAVRFHASVSFGGTQRTMNAFSVTRALFATWVRRRMSDWYLSDS